jgi:hypothetical protein
MIKFTGELIWSAVRLILAMKPHRLLLSVLAGFAVIGPVFASEPTAKTEARTEVIFLHPEKFSDVRDASMGSDKGRDGILEQLKNYIVQRTKTYVPAGQQLIITVTDVDLAGDFEPWRGPEMTDVRVVKDIYPPKIDLEYTLTGPGGKVVKTGKRQLRDLAFQMKISINRDDPLRYEKSLLDDWLRSDFPRVKSG